MKRTYHEGNKDEDDGGFSEEGLKKISDRITEMKKLRPMNNLLYDPILFNTIEDEYKNFLYKKITDIMNTFSFNIIFNKKLDQSQTNMLREKVHKLQIILDNMYYCCSDQVKTYLLDIGSAIKRNNYDFDLRNIYSALILTAYSMLGEQQEDFLKIEDSPPQIRELFLNLTTGDLNYEGRNISSEVRRFLLGLNNREFEGGKKRRNKYKNVKTKRKNIKRMRKTRRWK